MTEATDSQGSVLARVEALVAEARELAGTDVLGEVDSVELPRFINAVEELGRVQSALSVHAARAMEADGGWALSGARTFAGWWAMRTGHHQTAARREVKTARDVRDHLPGSGAALAAGQISGDHLQALSSHATRTQRLREQLGDEEFGEEFLLAHARAMDATSFAKVVRAWAVAADPQAADREWVEDSAAEHMFLSRTMDGWAFRGWLSPADGVALDEVLTARMGAPAAGEERLPSQRRAAALLDVARQVLDSGELQSSARVRPHVAVTVPFETLQRLIEAADPAQQESSPVPSLDPGPCPAAAGGVQGVLEGLNVTHEAGRDPLEGVVISTSIDPEVMRGTEPATLADQTPLPPALLARLVCDGELHRVVFGPESEVLDAGRTRRLFSPGQARAVIARDRHCQYPGCHAPPGRGEIHHSVWWYEQRGGTDVRDGVLLCWHHHDWVHQMSITIQRTGGRWRFIKPSGLEVTTRPQAA